MAKIAVLVAAACLLMGNMSEGSGHTYNLAGQWKEDERSRTCSSLTDGMFTHGETTGTCLPPGTTGKRTAQTEAPWQLYPLHPQ